MVLRKPYENLTGNNGILSSYEYGEVMNCIASFRIPLKKGSMSIGDAERVAKKANEKLRMSDYGKNNQYLKRINTQDVFLVFKDMVYENGS